MTLTDVNDNCPQFSSEEYRVTIFETIGVGTDILQLFTTDRDIGNNARSVYSKVYGEGTDYEGQCYAGFCSTKMHVKQCCSGFAFLSLILSIACIGNNL